MKKKRARDKGRVKAADVAAAFSLSQFENSKGRMSPPKGDSCCLSGPPHFPVPPVPSWQRESPPLLLVLGAAFRIKGNKDNCEPACGLPLAQHKVMWDEILKRIHRRVGAGSLFGANY